MCTYLFAYKVISALVYSRAFIQLANTLQTTRAPQMNLAVGRGARIYETRGKRNGENQRPQTTHPSTLAKSCISGKGHVQLEFESEAQRLLAKAMPNWMLQCSMALCYE